MIPGRLGTSCDAGVLFTVAWLSGQPFVFPSLGPSPFLLPFERRGDRGRLSRIVASHSIDGVAGLVAYTLLGAGFRRQVGESLPQYTGRYSSTASAHHAANGS